MILLSQPNVKNVIAKAFRKLIPQSDNNICSLTATQYSIQSGNPAMQFFENDDIIEVVKLNSIDCGIIFL
jgi:hypothetical protein